MQLKMVEGQYIFKDNLPVYRVIKEEFAEEIFAQISAILAKHSSEVAFQVLDTLSTTLEGKIRKCNDYDLMRFASQHTEARRLLLGEKHECKSCKRKFYDLHENLDCPLCHTKIVELKLEPATLVSM